MDTEGRPSPWDEPGQLCESGFWVADEQPVASEAGMAEDGVDAQAQATCDGGRSGGGRSGGETAACAGGGASLPATPPSSVAEVDPFARHAAQLEMTLQQQQLLQYQQYQLQLQQQHIQHMQHMQQMQVQEQMRWTREQQIRQLDARWVPIGAAAPPTPPSASGGPPLSPSLPPAEAMMAGVPTPMTQGHAAPFSAYQVAQQQQELQQQPLHEQFHHHQPVKKQEEDEGIAFYAPEPVQVAPQVKTETHEPPQAPAAVGGTDGQAAGTGSPLPAAPAAPAAPATDSKEQRKPRRGKRTKPSEKNIADCRAYRQRERRKRQELEDANLRMEAQREEYLKRIADLKRQAEQLRGDGEINLRVENALLREEICKHKAFIENVVRVGSAGAPLEPKQVRELAKGIDSAAGQALSLSIISASDPAWERGQPMRVGGHEIPIKFLYLPKGVPRSEATRLNIRMDVDDFPYSFEQFNGNSLKFFGDPVSMNKTFEAFRKQANLDRVVQQIYPPLDGSVLCADDLDGAMTAEAAAEAEAEAEALGPKLEDLRVIRFVSSSSNAGGESAAAARGAAGVRAGDCGQETFGGPAPPDAEAILVIAHKTVSVQPSALWRTPDFEGQDACVQTAINVQVSSASTTLPSHSSTSGTGGKTPRRLESQLLRATVVQPKAEDPTRCNAVFVGSYPIGDEGYKQLTGKQRPHFDEAGKMDEAYERKIDAQFRAVFGSDN